VLGFSSMKRALLGAVFAGLFGCSTSGIEGIDASSGDGAGSDGTGGDATASDGSPSDGAANEGAASDAGGSDVTSGDGACACEPYWCGCGACNPGDIACTVNPPPCNRGCASSCPELQQTTCSCEEGRCIRSGVDASAIGCLKDEDCPQGDCCAFAQGAGHCATSPNTCCITPCP
jgi:hypothetical protein